ncbi:MAG: class I SAM-dependent methyltransferase [Chloroflexi bacterium]|nr:class I SAM-dependent methyltransferase [Chloroflexota bacterium]
MAYDEPYFITRESWRDWRIEARALIDLARATRDARVLEIGCGGGGLLQMLRARGAFAIGIDTLDVALHLARERLSLRAQFAKQSPTSQAEIASSRKPLLAMTGDGALPFRDHMFDALIAQHVVEHIDDLDAALREWQRVLKPGGRLALATPNARYPDPAHFADADHARVFAPEELRDAFARAGFSVF